MSTDTLTGLAREVAALTRSGRDYRDGGGDDAARALAARIEAFAAGEPALAAKTRRNYLVRLARCIDPGTPADTGVALRVLGLPIGSDR